MEHNPLAGLGRLHVPDERDLRYPLAAALPRESTWMKPWRYHRTPGFVLDQGSTSQCVAYSARMYMLTSDTQRNVQDLPNGHSEASFYRLCQQNDEWPGEEPTYAGTSVRAAAKMLKAAGAISEYRWAWDAATVAQHLLQVGPVMLGTTWTMDMFRPDRNGFIRPTGSNAGGHAYLAVGVNTVAENPDGSVGRVRCINSWGPRWGPHVGRFNLSLRDLDTLLLDYGEACVAVERKVTT